MISSQKSSQSRPRPIRTRRRIVLALRPLSVPRPQPMDPLSTHQEAHLLRASKPLRNRVTRPMPLPSSLLRSK